jgi:hypothetical protein
MKEHNSVLRLGDISYTTVNSFKFSPHLLAWFPGAISLNLR